MANVLFLANLVPYPSDNGGKIFTKSVLTSLSKHNKVDLVCFYEKEDIEKAKKELEQFCQSIIFIKAKITTKENLKIMLFKAFASLFSNKPLAILKYNNKKMREVLKKLLTVNNYDYVFFNILAMCLYMNTIKRTNARVKTILYEQNCEETIYDRLVKNSSNLLKKMFLKIERRKLGNFERKMISSVNKLILLSYEDKKALNLTRECAIIPIGISPSSYTKSVSFDGLKLKMLFVGTMTWEPNNEGIIWFLEKVMPLCTNDRFCLSIVGKNPSEKVKKLAFQYENVQILGYVENLEYLYNSCDVMIVPLFVGSGQRVKILEAFSKAFPVVSTSVGVEGLKCIDEENVLIANNRDEFFLKLSECFSGEKLNYIGANGKKLFLNEYSEEVISKRINELIE